MDMQIVNVVVDGEEQELIQNGGDTWVELAESDTYEIQLDSPFRGAIRAVVAVDGLNATSQARIEDPVYEDGIVVQTGQRVTVPGWRVGDKEWAEFEVCRAGVSPAAQENSGQISPEIGRIDVHFVSGNAEIITPMSRGDIEADLGTDVGLFKKVKFEDLPQDVPFKPKDLLVSKTIFYASRAVLRKFRIIE